ncbi:unnamed protein product [Brassica napus]|uniref:(rape) hypothetical protein n=1 Tax=Brassica napus TaxID=3708 RepID=A0A816KFT5_BRANA|nr:unnamed protein product [Brassica napus]
MSWRLCAYLGLISMILLCGIKRVSREDALWITWKQATNGSSLGDDWLLWSKTGWLLLQLQYLYPKAPSWKQVAGGVTAAGMYAGLRASGKKPNLALVTCDVGAVAAGVFTMNAVAAPVVYCKKVLGSAEVSKKDDPKVIILMQQAEFLSSLARNRAWRTGGAAWDYWQSPFTSFEIL